MKIKTKGILRKIALVLAGVAAITAVGFGVKAIVDYTKEDLKTISPSFEVGNLGADGKYVNDESTLYTKDAFACYGLQVKPDFDSTVNYQIFYYDILDNYISSTSTLSDGYSAEAPLNGAYARMVIEPKEDEDGKISFTEKLFYPKQLTVKVKKNQDINERFVSFQGRVMQCVNSSADLVFENKLALSEEALTWYEHSTICVTSSTFLKVGGSSTIKGDFSALSSDSSFSFTVFEFSGLPAVENYIGFSSVSDSTAYECTLNKKTETVIVSVYKNTVAWTESELTKLPLCFSITKTK